MRTRALGWIVAALGGWVPLSACAPTEVTPALHIFDGATMGTTYAVRVVTADSWDQARRDRVRGRIQATLDDVEAKMSHFDPASELSRFNQSRATEPFALSSETIDVVRHAAALSGVTEGALDITVGPLVNAWGFGPEEPQVLPPDADLVARLREQMGHAKLELDEAASTLRKTIPELECDLSAVAKGYSADQVGAALRDEGLSRFMVEVGGEIVTAGLNQQGGPWRIAIERPTMEGGVQRVVPLSGQAMATSGDYRNVREVDGRLYSHTIDPRTGWPVAHRLASVSVIADLCVVADGLATALEVLGPDEGYALAVEQGWAALFLIRDETGAVSERATPAFEAVTDAGPPDPRN